MGKVRESAFSWPPVEQRVALPFGHPSAPAFQPPSLYPYDFARPQQTLEGYHQPRPAAFPHQELVPFYQTISEQVKEGFHIPPWGVTLRPPQGPTNRPPPSPQAEQTQAQCLTPSSPMSPSDSSLPSSPGTPMTPLSPLSCGGYLYHYPPAQLTPQPPQPPLVIPVHTPSPPQFTTNSPNFVSPEIAERQAKLEKYREKRQKRNFNRPVDHVRRERAHARTREASGQFACEKADRAKMLQELVAYKRESILLRDRLSAVEQELETLRKRAEEASEYKATMEQMLEEQQKRNEVLQTENNLLWSSVPMDEVFSTIKPSNPTIAEAFKEKIDFSSIELSWTGSPFLEAAREEEDFKQRWENLEYIADDQS